MKDFIHFLKEKQQRRELGIFAGLFLIIGILLHILYPYPFSFPDSGAYLIGASQNVFNIYRPQGYSRYLKFLHALSEDISFTYYFTYFVTALSILALLFSVKYLLHIRNKLLFYGLGFLSILSPRILFSCNFLMSDGLFNLLTILFLTTALWLLFSGNRLLIIAHLLIFAALYQVRYSGMFYLPISMLVLVLSPAAGSKARKFILAVLPILCFFILYSINKSEYHKQTGTDISSGFSGWQLLNNASVLFPEAKEIPASRFRDQNLKALHTFMQSCPDSLFSDKHTMTTNYMWSKELPQKQFLSLYLQYSKQYYQPGWVYVGSLYQEYAKMLILQRPWEYFGKFILPSFWSTFKFHPIIEEATPLKLDQYAAEYYHMTTQPYTQEHRVFTSLNSVRKGVNYVYWIFLFIVTLYYFIFCIRKKYFTDKIWQGGFLFIAFILIYIGISCIASPNTTWRYSLPVFIPSLIFMAHTINQIIDNGKIKSKLLFPRKK